MGSIKGKLEVDLYANPDPMIQGFMKGEAAAKRHGDSIAGHLDKINAKQMKNVVGGALKAVGVVGAIEVGQQIILATIKGMADGTVKGMGDFGMVAAKAVTGVVKSLPVLGTFMEIGEEIGKMVAGVNELEAAAAKSRNQFDQIGKVLTLMDASKKTGTAGADSAFLKTVQFGMTEDEITRQNTLIQMKKEDHAANQAYIEMANKAMKEEASSLSENGILYVDQDIMLKRKQQLTAAISKFEQTQLKHREKINDEMKKSQDDLQKQITQEKEVADQQIKREKELIELGKARAKIVEEMLSKQEELSKSNMGVNAASGDLESAQANRDASATSVSSALGSIKIEGVSDFSKSKEIEKAKEALAAAKDTQTNTKNMVDQLIKLNQNIGATP